jgi:hypothetical protein
MITEYLFTKSIKMKLIRKIFMLKYIHINSIQEDNHAFQRIKNKKFRIKK